MQYTRLQKQVKNSYTIPNGVSGLDLILYDGILFARSRSPGFLLYETVQV